MKILLFVIIGVLFNELLVVLPFGLPLNKRRRKILEGNLKRFDLDIFGDDILSQNIIGQPSIGRVPYSFFFSYRISYKTGLIWKYSKLSKKIQERYDYLKRIE